MVVDEAGAEQNQHADNQHPGGPLTEIGHGVDNESGELAQTAEWFR